MLDALAAHIDKVLDAHDDHGRRTRWEARPGSPSDIERGLMRRQMGPAGVALWDGSDAGRAGEIGALFGQLAAQHLDAIRVLLVEREVMFSLAPLTRSILEIAGHVYWLLDNAVHDSPRDRAARVLLARIDDATRRRSAARLVAHPNMEQMTASLNHLRRDLVPAMFYGSEIDRDRSGRITIRNQQVPGLGASLRYIEQVTGVDWNTPAMYAYLSNASHPTFHVVREAYEFDETTRRGAFVARDGQLPYKLTRAALMSFIRVWQINAKYLGHDDDRAGGLGVEIGDRPAPIVDT